MTRLAAFLLLSALAAAPAAVAQTRASRPAKRPQPPVKVAAAEAEPVDVRAVFAVSTGAERWALEDPQPRDSVDFGGKRMSFEERLVNTALNPTGESQLLFPVSWYEPYQRSGADLKYVVVRYREGKAFQIVAEYIPQRMSLPLEQFTRHPDGKSYYSDLSVARQDGRLYTKQAISQGAPDGKGGLWVDTIVIYAVEEKTQASTR